MSVSNEFKNITKKIKQQNIKLSICDGELTVKEIHMMPVHIFNALPVWKLRKRKEVIAKELKYSFDGQLFKTIMKQIEITVKNANEIKDKDINFKYGLLINEKFEYVDLGNYFIKDIEDSKKKDEITVTGYDRMIRFMKTFKQSELQLTYPCQMSKLVQRMCEVCGVELYSMDFYNSDLKVAEDFFTAQELTYRDVLEKVAQATLTTAFIENNKLNLYKINDEDPEKIDKSYLTDLTIKEKFGPVNVLVLGRGDVEDNVEEPDEESIKQNGRCEIRFDENEFVEYQREKVIKGMFEQINGLEYYSFEASDVGVMWLKPCTCIALSDKEDNLYKSYYLKANITINIGISSDIEAELPEGTNTEYKVTTKEEKKALKVERLAKKNEGLIQDLVEENTEQSKKITQVEQTVDGISQKVENIQDFTKEKTQMENIELTDVAEGEGYLLKFIVYGNTEKFKTKDITICSSKNRRGYGETIYLMTEDGTELLTEDGQEFIIGEGSYYLKSIKITLDDYLRNLTQNGKEYFDTLEIEQDGTIKIVKRIGVNSKGELYALAKEQETVLKEKIVLPSAKEQTYYFIKEISGLNYYAQYIIENDYSKTFLTKLELGTKIEQNAEAVKVAWNQISEFIQMMIINNNASLAILSKDNKVMMSLDKNGQHFFNENGEDIFGEMGVEQEGEQNYISFAVDGEYGETSENGMAWGIKTKSDGVFHPIFYIKDFEMGSKASENAGGNLVLTACNLVLEGLGKGIVSGGIKIFGDPGGDKLYFEDTESNQNLMVIDIGNNITTYASINILDKISFFRNQAGSNSFKIGENNNFVLFTDNGDISAKGGEFAINTQLAYFYGGNLMVADGNVYANNISSDRRIKENIKDSEVRALDIVKKIQHRQFYKKTDDKHYDIGYIAQELEEIDPNFVLISPKTARNDEMYYVNELPIVATLSKAIQEQQEEIEKMQETIKTLQNQISKLEGEK